VKTLSENTFSESREFLKKYGLSIEYCSGTTQITAANLFNLFYFLPIVLEQPCAACKFSLCLSHGFDNGNEADVIIEAVGNEADVMVEAVGNKKT